MFFDHDAMNPSKMNFLFVHLGSHFIILIDKWFLTCPKLERPLLSKTIPFISHLLERFGINISFLETGLDTAAEKEIEHLGFCLYESADHPLLYGMDGASTFILFTFSEEAATFTFSGRHTKASYVLNDPSEVIPPGPSPMTYSFDHKSASRYRRRIVVVRPIWEIIFVISLLDDLHNNCCLCFGRCSLGFPFGSCLGFRCASLSGSRIAVMLVWAIGAIALALCEKETRLFTFRLRWTSSLPGPSPPFPFPGP